MVRTAALVTLVAWVLSVGISAAIDYVLHGDVALQVLFFAMVVPLLISPVLTAAFLRLVLQLETLQARLNQISITDELTRAFNRRHWMELAEIELTRTIRHGRVFSILLIDIDDFKRINDTQGHLAGDHVLRGLSRVCLSHSRTTDAFGRYGGEEFVFLLPEADVPAARRFAERIRATIESARFPYLDSEIQITVSIGAATLDATMTTLDELFARVDRALYAAKRSGKNRVIAAEELETAHA
jgi:diguanylate cyclase (GGDEF)-like protein